MRTLPAALLVAAALAARPASASSSRPVARDAAETSTHAERTEGGSTTRTSTRAEAPEAGEASSTSTSTTDGEALGWASATSTATQPAASGLGRALGDEPLSVTADHLIATPRAGEYVAEGEVIVTRGLGASAVSVRADRVSFDVPNRRGLAEGHVAVVEGRGVLFCRRVELTLPAMIGGIHDAELHIRSGAPGALGAALARGRAAGRDQFVVRAEELERVGARRLEIHGGAFTACDCAEGASATWSIDARSASIDLDQGAWLSWPVFYAKGLPVFALPAFYLPLGERRTGLLAPRLGHARVTGLRFSEPFFLTLGESWDTTIEAGMMLDRGPTAELELRWAPDARSSGLARISTLFDTGVPDGAGGYSRTRARPVPRYAITAKDSTVLEGVLDRAELAVDVNLVGDPAYVAELADSFLTRQVETSSSRVTLTAADGGVRVSGGLAWLQDLRAARYDAGELRTVHLFSSALSPDGRLGPGAVRSRLAELRLDALPHGLGASPVLGDARLELSVSAAPSEAIARFVRADFRPNVSAPLSLFDVATLEPSLALVLSAWSGSDQGASATATRLGLVGRLALSTELGRRYGAWLHRVKPIVEYLAVPVVSGGPGVFDTKDELDLVGTVSQVRARLITDLFEAASGRRAGGLELGIGRDLGLSSTRGVGTSSFVARADAELPPLFGVLRAALDARSAFDVERGVLEELIAGFSLGLGAHRLAAHYGQLGASVPTYAFVGAEELVRSSVSDLSVFLPLADHQARRATNPDLAPWSAYRGVELALGVTEALPGAWGRLTVASGANLTFDGPSDRPAGAVLYGPRVLRNTQTTLRWDSSCDCLGLGAVVATSRDRPGVDLVSVVIDLAGLGSVSAVR